MREPNSGAARHSRARGVRRGWTAVIICCLVLTACGSRRPTAEHLLSAGISREDQTAGLSSATDAASVLDPSLGDDDGGSSAVDQAVGGSSASVGRDADAGSAGGSGDTTPIVIGSVGNYSGAPGTAQAPGPRSVQVWVNKVNAEGGLAGHRVEYIVVDDGSDPARHKAAIQDLVENKKVIAFVGNFATQTDAAARDYLESKRVPVIGGTGTSFHVSPMFFPNFAATPDVVFGAMVNAKRFSGKTKLATLTCVEADVCSVYKDAAQKYAGEAGLEIVYQADVSIAQPDYTSECIRAKGAGAQLLMPVGDQNTIRRVAESCQRQGVNAVVVNVLPDETQQGDSLFTASTVGTQYFPFVGVSGNAGANEYLGAFEKFAPNEPLNTITSAGWGAAKLFEKAALKGIGTNRPTTTAVLEALWSFKNETIGGLTVPLTFAKDKPAVSSPCWFSMHMVSGKWTAPDGIKATCR